MSEWLLPLFPLQVVLFPQTDLPLHIFEERYKQMINECLQARQEFGVVLAQEGGIESAGCAAVVSKVIQRYQDGRLDIIARGTRRFEITLLNEEMPYLRGAPQFFDDEPSTSPADDAKRMKVMQLFANLQGMLDVHPSADTKLELGNAQLSYQLMARLPVDVAFKQSLLQLRSEDERLARVIPALEKLTAQVAVAKKARASASGNGKGR